jgi:NTP pyrophosphatase (non-canonical NTP hydrolase)
MDVNDYQKNASRTLLEKPDFTLDDKETMIIWNALGLVGEAGEVSELIKKSIFHQHGLDIQKLEKELGDVLWYVAALSTTLGLNLSDLMEKNILKLKERYPDGFTSQGSIDRIEKE